jgi:hypothetical protein
VLAGAETVGRLELERAWGREFVFPHRRERRTGVLEAFLQCGSGLPVASVRQTSVVARYCVGKELAEAAVAFTDDVRAPARMFSSYRLAVKSALEGFGVLAKIMKKSRDEASGFGIEARSTFSR